MEALHSQEAPVPANSVELRFLWADAPTFWSLLQKAEKSTSFIVAHRSDQSSAAGCPGMIAPNQNEGASQMRKV